MIVGWKETGKQKNIGIPEGREDTLSPTRRTTGNQRGCTMCLPWDNRGGRDERCASSRGIYERNDREKDAGLSSGSRSFPSSVHNTPHRKWQRPQRWRQSEEGRRNAMTATKEWREEERRKLKKRGSPSQRTQYKKVPRRNIKSPLPCGRTAELRWRYERLLTLSTVL